MVGLGKAQLTNIDTSIFDQTNASVLLAFAFFNSPLGPGREQPNRPSTDSSDHGDHDLG